MGTARQDEYLGSTGNYSAENADGIEEELEWSGVACTCQG